MAVCVKPGNSTGRWVAWLLVCPAHSRQQSEYRSTISTAAPSNVQAPRSAMIKPPQGKHGTPKKYLRLDYLNIQTWSGYRTKYGTVQVSEVPQRIRATTAVPSVHASFGCLVGFPKQAINTKRCSCASRQATAMSQILHTIK